MARVTDTEVKTILATTVDTTPFIDTANIFINEVLGTAGLSEALLTKIELWLSAHFTCMMDPRVSFETISSAQGTFEGKTGMSLDFTRYGQQAKLLDSSGRLANAGKLQGRVTVASRTESFTSTAGDS